MKYINALIILASLQTAIIASESSAKLTPEQLALLVKDVYKPSQSSLSVVSTAVDTPETYSHKNAFAPKKTVSQKKQTQQPYYCEYTNQHFPTPGDHYHECYLKKRIQCPECSREYSHSYIRQHIMDFHGAPSHACTACGKKHKWRKQAIACCPESPKSTSLQMKLRAHAEPVGSVALSPIVAQTAPSSASPMDITPTCEQESQLSKVTSDFLRDLPDATRLRFGSSIFMELSELE